MSQKNRLGAGGRINRAIPLTFTFNGRTYQGYQGDTLASALLANDVHFVARSFKYHRPRGIVTADVAEPNAVVQLETGAYTVPNARATEVELYQGLVATSVNAEPSLENDRMAINQKFSRFLPAGFSSMPRQTSATVIEAMKRSSLNCSVIHITSSRDGKGLVILLMTLLSSR